MDSNKHAANRQSDEYPNEANYAEGWETKIWKAVIIRALNDWRRLHLYYNIRMHRELFRFFFFDSQLMTVYSICDTILDDNAYLHRIRRAAVRIAKGGEVDLLRLELPSDKPRECCGCKKVVPFYDSWAYFEADFTELDPKLGYKGRRVNYCFDCEESFWRTERGRVHPGTTIKMLKKEMRQRGTIQIDLSTPVMYGKFLAKKNGMAFE